MEKVHNRVTVSDEISFICTVLYLKCWKISELSIINMTSWISINPDNSTPHPPNSNRFSFPLGIWVTKCWSLDNGDRASIGKFHCSGVFSPSLAKYLSSISLFSRVGRTPSDFDPILEKSVETNIFSKSVFCLAFCIRELNWRRHLKQVVWDGKRVYTASTCYRSRRMRGMIGTLAWLSSAVSEDSARSA